MNPLEFNLTRRFSIAVHFPTSQECDVMNCRQDFMYATRPDGNVDHRSYWLDQYYKQMNSLDSDERKSVLRQILDGIVRNN